MDQTFQGCCRGGSRSRSRSLTRCYPFGGLISFAELYSLFSKESCSIPLFIRHSFVFWGNQVFRQSLPYMMHSIHSETDHHDILELIPSPNRIHCSRSRGKGVCVISLTHQLHHNVLLFFYFVEFDTSPGSPWSSKGH
jgi:hypothetical protein